MGGNEFLAITDYDGGGYDHASKYVLLLKLLLILYKESKNLLNFSCIFIHVRYDITCFFFLIDTEQSLSSCNLYDILALIYNN